MKIVKNNEILEKLKPKANPKLAGYCTRGHYAGIGVKKCKICDRRVR